MDGALITNTLIARSGGMTGWREHGEMLVADQNRFTVSEVAEGIWSIEEPLESEVVRSYLIVGERDVAILDTGAGIGNFTEVVRSLTDRAPLVIQSHAHWDHIGASHQYPRVLIHASEAEDLRHGLPNALYRTIFTPAYVDAHPLPAGFDLNTAAIQGVEPTGFLTHGERIDLGGRMLEIYHTPGHSPGGVTIADLQTRLLFPGDAGNHGPMYLFYPTCDPAAWRTTIHLLADLARDAAGVYPSHDAAPLTGSQIEEIRDACESMWAGTRQPDAREEMDIGEGISILVDTFDDGAFQFLLPHGRYGREQHEMKE